MTKTQITHFNQANKYQKKVSYDSRDKVWLLTKNISIDRSSKKLDYKIIDFFKVIGMKDILLELQLFQAIKIYNVFYFNLL